MKEMLHIIGKPSTQEILEVVWVKSNIENYYNKHKKALTANYGKDWSLFKSSGSSKISKRIKANEKWKAVWKNKKIVDVLFLFKSMVVKDLIKHLKSYDKNREIFMTSRIQQGTYITAINFIGEDKNGNLVITLDDNLLKEKH